MNQNHKILKLADNCTFLEGLRFYSETFCIKTRFLNAVLCRWESNYTQDDVAEYLDCSKRTVVEIEKGNVTNVVTILNYIHFFGENIAEKRQAKVRREYYKRVNKH